MLKRINLVYAEDCRHMQISETLHKLFFRRTDFALRLRNKHRKVNVGNGISNLFYHKVGKLCSRFMKTGSINKHELSLVFCKNTGNSCSGCLGLCGNSRDFFAHKGVEQRAFSHVRAADNGNKRRFGIKIFKIHRFTLRHT